MSLVVAESMRSGKVVRMLPTAALVHGLVCSSLVGRSQVWEREP